VPQVKRMNENMKIRHTGLAGMADFYGKCSVISFGSYPFQW